MISTNMQNNAPPKYYNNIRFIMKLFLPTVMTFALLAIAMSYVAYKDQRTNMIKDRVEAAKVITSVASDTIIGNDIVQVKTEADISKVVYYKILTQFNMINKHGHLNNIYSIYFDNNTVYYGVVEEKDGEVLTGTEVKHLSTTYPDISKLEQGELISDSNITYNDYNEPIISAFAPIFDSKKNLVGAIVCDYDATVILNELNVLISNLVIFTLIIIGISSLLILFIIKLIINKLVLINAKLRIMSTDGGDLTEEIPVKSRDEIGIFSIHINKFIGYIRKIFSNISSQIKTLDRTIYDAYEGIEDANDSINRTNFKIKDIYNSVSDMAYSIDNIGNASVDILDNISSSNIQLSNGINYALSIKRHAEKTTEDALRKQAKAKQNISNLSKTLNEKLALSADVVKITDLAKDILDITDETNLLALNASIKAAKAGVHGKGFSVVADELSKLAVTTEISINEIDDASGYIVKSVNNLADAIKDMLDFINDLSITVFSDLVTNSELYLKNSEQLTGILEHFSDFTQILDDKLTEVQSTLIHMKNDVDTSSSNMEYISSLSHELTLNTDRLKGELTTTKDIGANLNTELSKYTV